MRRSMLLSMLWIQACTSGPITPVGPAPAAVASPLKVAVLFDGSQSMTVTDPNGARVTALLDLLQMLPQDGSVHVQVGVFSAGTIDWQLPTGFQPLTSLTGADRQALGQKVLTFVTRADAPNRDTSSFVSPLDAAYDLISADLDCSATYSVILLSDGHPTNDEDDQLLCGAAVTRFQTLGQQVAGVHINTAFVFEPSQPLPGSSCAYDPGTGCAVATPDATCPQSFVAADAARLQRIAGLGGGAFAQFSGTAPVTFSDLVPVGASSSAGACGP